MIPIKSLLNSKKKSILLLTIFIVLSVIVFKISSNYTNKAILIEQENIKNQSESQYLVYVFSPVCSSCQTFDKTLSDYKKQDNALTLYKVNIDLSKAKGNPYRIQKTPTLLHIKNGREVWRMEGAFPLHDIPRGGD